jgi:hypothetical protein
MRYGWMSLAILVVCALPACGSDPHGQGAGPVEDRGAVLVPSLSGSSASAPKPISASVPSVREMLHQHLRELTLLLNSRPPVCCGQWARL